MKKIIQYGILVVFTALMVVGILWARGKKSDEVCSVVDIQVVNDTTSSLVTPDGIMRELEAKGVKPEGMPMWQIDTDKIEQMLAKSDYLEQVDCVKAQNGRIIIRVKQIVPVMRVFDGDASYYVNREGKRMKASVNFHADVPIIQGHFADKYQPTRLLPLIDFVNSDSTLKQLVTMYCFNDSNNIILIPSIYGHVINVGNTDNLANKFRKLKLFYNKVMPEKGWKYYDTISVKWDYQIVATRANKARRKKEVYVAETDTTDERPDAGTMSTQVISTEPSKTALDARRKAQAAGLRDPNAEDDNKAEGKKSATDKNNNAKPKAAETGKKGKKT